MRLVMEMLRMMPTGGVRASTTCFLARLPSRIYNGHSVPSMVMLLMLMPSMVPPSTISRDIPVIPWRGVLNIGFVSLLLGLTTQLLMVMLRNPPVDSVPALIALQKLDTTQLVITTSSVGAGPVLLSVMPSSSESIIELDKTTRRQPSISIPSLLRLEWLYTSIRSISTSSQSR